MRNKTAIDLELNQKQSKGYCIKIHLLRVHLVLTCWQLLMEKPEQCGLLKFLNLFLSFREDVVLKKTKFDLKKAQARSHILIGLSLSERT